MKKPLVIAHRGASYELPGNTLPAIQKAIKDGADWIEIDLRRTKDGEIVVMHNDCKDTITELRSKYKVPFCPPTLEEVLKAVPKSTVFYFDIKELKMAYEVKKIANKYGFNKSWYSNKESLIFAYTPLLYYYPFVPVTLYGVQANQMPCFIIERACLPYYEHIPSLCRLVHGLGRKLFVWGVNQEHEMKKWIKIGADGILTDRPGELNKIINKPISNDQ